MAALNGRSPFEVVWGFQPQIPTTLAGALPVQNMGVDAYVQELVKYFEYTHRDVNRHMKEIAEAKEGTEHGAKEPTLAVGDVVLRLKDHSNAPKGTHRFDGRCDGTLYRVHRAAGPNTVELERLDGSVVVDLRGKPTLVDAYNLIKCDLPEFEVNYNPNEKRRLEIQHPTDHNIWNRATLENFTADGKAALRFDNQPATVTYYDLTQTRFRWLYHEPGRS